MSGVNLSAGSLPTYLAEYWYMILAGFIVAVILFVTGIILLAKATRQLKENANVARGRRQAIEEQKRLDEERARLLKESAALGAEDAFDPIDEAWLNEEIAEPEPDNVEETVVEVEAKIGGKREIKAVYRVIYDRDNKEWMVKKDGAQRVIRRVKTKVEALELAHQFAGNQDLSVSVQKRDGRFQKKRNYTKMLTADKKE